jgi:lipopolysaccharide/colanic/teichoic acid biosynthesis glycosyltransferase
VQFLHLIERLRDVAENILIVPDLAEAPVLGVEVVGLMEDRALLLRLPNNLLKPWNLALKRAFDLVVGGALAVALLPCIALLAVAVRLDSPGPAFHVEPRVGRRRHPFACYKLRTMYQDADRLLDAYLHDRPEAALEWARFRKLRAYDPRVTSFGRLLRRYSLDELPQLMNVVCGEMSLVGPRPYLPSEMALLEHDGMCGVRPGMTGLWQVSGKNQLELRERARLERWYVNNWSLWLDVIVLAKTIPAIARSR